MLLAKTLLFDHIFFSAVAQSFGSFRNNKVVFSMHIELKAIRAVKGILLRPYVAILAIVSFVMGSIPLEEMSLLQTGPWLGRGS